MPELPEVETIRRDLDAEVAGRRVVDVVATGERSVRRHRSPGEFVSSLRGNVVERVRRHGKYLVLGLAGRDESLLVHLRMSGQLLLVAGDPPPPAPRHTHVVLILDDGRELRFVDPRTFGEVFVGSSDAVLSALGPDALDPGTDTGALVRASRRRLKDLLMDQRVVAGIGNIYSDEILWHARLRYDRPGSSLDGSEARRLTVAVRQVLARAVALRGSSLADEQYRDLYGRRGDAAAAHRAFARATEPCPRCATPIERIRHAGRSHFFCPRCQALP